MVLFAFALTALLGFSALVIDGSHAYLSQQEMQIAADSAALAGARQIALGAKSHDVDSAIQEYASANGADTVTWSYTKDNRGVAVRAEVSYPTYFAGLVGMRIMSVAAESEARMGVVSGTDNLLPMTLPCSADLAYGELYNVWDKADRNKDDDDDEDDDDDKDDDKKSNDKKDKDSESDSPAGKDAPGAFGWLDWNGGSRGNPELAESIANPQNSGYWEVGDWVYSGPGVQSSSNVKSALEIHVRRGDSVTIPLYGSVKGSGANTQYQICGFAQFILVEFDFQGNDKYVSGRFVKKIMRGSIDDDATDQGMRAISLSK